MNIANITMIVHIIVTKNTKNLVVFKEFLLILFELRLARTDACQKGLDQKPPQRKPAKLAAKSNKAVQRQFTMLPSEGELIEKLRRKYQREGLKRKATPIDIVKSEIIRAGILSLDRMSAEDLFEIIEAVEELKEGRPKKETA